MKISYEVEKKDLWKFHWYYLSTHKFCLKFISVIAAVQFLISFIPFFNALVLLIKGQFWADVPVFLYFATVFVYCFAWFALNMTGTAAITIAGLALFELAQLRTHANGDGVIGHHTLELGETYLREVTDVNDTKHCWKNIRKIVERKTIFLLFTSSNSAHIIPKRSFQTEADAALFFEETKRLKENSNAQYLPSYLASTD